MIIFYHPALTKGMYTKKACLPGKPADLTSLDALQYRNNWTEPIPAEKVFDSENATANVYITSIGRDVTADPSPFHFRSKLPVSFKNVVSVRILQMILPAAADLAAQPHVFVDIPELPCLDDARTGATYTAMATFTPHFGSRGFLNIDPRTLAPVGCVFKPHKPRLDSITFSLRNFDGAVYTPTDAALSGSVLPQHQVSFVLEVVTRTRKNPNSQTIT